MLRNQLAYVHVFSSLEEDWIIFNSREKDYRSCGKMENPTSVKNRSFKQYDTACNKQVIAKNS